MYLTADEVYGPSACMCVSVTNLDLQEKCRCMDSIIRCRKGLLNRTGWKADFLFNG